MRWSLAARWPSTASGQRPLLNVGFDLRHSATQGVAACDDECPKREERGQNEHDDTGHERPALLGEHGHRREDDGQLQPYFGEVEVRVFALQEFHFVLKLLGPTAPKLAEQGADQLLYFFTGIANYTHKHPDKLDELLAPAKK